MTRFSLAASLALILGAATASADVAHFARPPQDLVVATADADAPTIDRAAVRSALAQARAANLARFRAYAARGVFPSNTFENRELNVWRDHAGHLCAAATIIDVSGQHALVAHVAKDNNFIRLADVHDGPLMDWILTSGLTQDEIVAIQRPFRPVAQPQQPDVVDHKLRIAEDARLRAKYASIDQMLVANEQKSLDLAVERVMKAPQLVAQLDDQARR
jgi:hypothetical protein